MSRPSSRYPTELELEILKILWREGSASVREVRDALTEFRDLAYTSVMTIMNIMARKGYLKRAKMGKSYIYETRVTEKATRRGILGDLVERLFSGSATALMVNLIETGDIDDNELEKLRSLLDEKSKEEQQ